MEWESFWTQYLQENRAAMVNDLIELVRVKSLKGEAAPGAPYGKAVREALDTAGRQLERLGLAMTVPEHARYGYVEIGTGEKVIGIMPHLDVVAADGAWASPPFEGIERDGYVMGRGASDDKGGAVGSVYALHAIVRSGVPLKNRIRLIFGCNEETGMEDAKTIVEEGFAPDFTLVPDAFFAIGVGQKGRFVFRATRPAAFRDVLSLCGGASNSANVPDLAEATVRYTDACCSELQALCPDDVECLAQGDTILLRAHGVAAHPAMPWNSKNAIWMLLDVLSRAETLAGEDRAALSELANLTAGCLGEGMGIAYQDELSGPLSAVCMQMEIKDQTVMLRMNIRFCVTMEGEALRERVTQKLSACGFALSDIGLSPAYLYSPSGAVVDALKAAYQKATGQEADLYVHPGGTYAGVLGNAVIYGNEFRVPGPFGTEQGGPHQVNEVTSVEGLLRSVRAYAEALLALDRLL